MAVYTRTSPPTLSTDQRKKVMVQHSQKIRSSAGPSQRRGMRTRSTRNRS